MALPRAKKAELIASYTEAIKGAKSAVYVKFKGLSVTETSTLRGQLFSEKTHYTVVKKTLWKRATDANAIKGEAPVTGEELAVVYGEDLLTPARLSYEFSKTHSRVRKKCFQLQRFLLVKFFFHSWPTFLNLQSRNSQLDLMKWHLKRQPSL
jgi:large subunit ribosomal protein L10